MKFLVQLVLAFSAGLAIGYELLNLWGRDGLAGPVQRALRAMVMVRQ
jgi:hypothetical protein